MLTRMLKRRKLINVVAALMVFLTVQSTKTFATNIDQTGSLNTSQQITFSVGYVTWAKAVSSFTGTVPQLSLYVYSAFTGSIKLALYSDSAGQPGALLATTATLTNLSPGVANFTISVPPAVVAGTAYWIAVAASGNNTYGAGTLSASVDQSSTFTGAFPSTASGLSNTSNNIWASITDGSSVVSQTGQSTTATSAWFGNFIYYTQVTAEAAGTLASIQMYLSTASNGSYKFGLYSDASGSPGSLLATSSTSVNPSTGLLSLSVTGGPSLVAGTQYWIAMINNSGGAAFKQNLPFAYYASGISFASAFPSTASGLTSTTSIFWGAFNITVPPSGKSSALIMQ